MGNEIGLAGNGIGLAGNGAGLTGNGAGLGIGLARNEAELIGNGAGLGIGLGVRMGGLAGYSGRMRGWGRVSLVCSYVEVYFLAFSTKCHFNVNISLKRLKGRRKIY